MSLTLAQALRANSCPSIAFIGAGGKTTAMFQLARQVQPPVVITTTTHLGIWQIPLADQHIIAATPESVEELENRLAGVTLITGDLDGNRTKPLNHSTLNWLHDYCSDHSIPLLIEADGARQKPLKAWADHEPPIPSFVKQVVQVVGLAGLGNLLNEKYVHRPELFSMLSGLSLGDSISADALTRVLTHPGGFKNVPLYSRKTVLLNQTDTPELQSIAHGLVDPLLRYYDAVLVSSLEKRIIFAVHESIAGIILAAGESSRYGQAKQLLDWKGKPFVRAVAITALEAGLSPVLVVTGANADQVNAALMDLNVKIIENEVWQSGQGSSIRAGVRALTANASLMRRMSGGAIFLLADQPQVTSSILSALMEKHSEGLYPIVAPMVMDRRANPVLFDRTTFSDLAMIEGDVGGRAIFHKHPVEYLPWHDDRLLLDVDTPEMYQRLISDETL